MNIFHVAKVHALYCSAFTISFLTHHCVTELENSVNISTSYTSHSAGQPYSLTCTVTSDRPTQIKWLDPNGHQVSGEGIAVSPQVTNGMVRTVEITFSSLHTSHSGIYTCISNINNPPSRKQAVHLLRVESKNLYICNMRSLYMYFSFHCQFHLLHF